jgi:gliding motility-associated-like protein
VVDNLPPTAVCRDITVALDENGEVSITAAQINNGSYDNCAIDTIVISRDHFDCTDLGPNTIQLIVTDVHGLKDTCTAVVTVIDPIAPEVTCIVRDTVQLSEEDGTYTLTFSMVTTSMWDNCTIVDTLLDKYVLTCDDIGTTKITATVIDQSGNEGQCTATFVVFGNIAPEALPDYDTTRMDIPVAVNVVQNDYDVGLKTDIRTSTLGILTAPQHGSVKVDTITGIVTYTPNKGYVGQDVFRYKICDDAIPCEEMCAWTYVYITVLPANEPPVALNDTFLLPCGDLLGNVMLNDYDPDGGDIFLEEVTVQPTNGILVYIQENGNFLYEPYSDFQEGVDSFQYVIRDVVLFGESEFDTAWVFIYRVADNDCDGVSDVDDIDDDNDGIRDIYEGDMMVDSDQDGIPDSWDIDSDNDGIVDNIEAQGEHTYIAPDGWRDDNNDGWDDRYDPDYGGFPFDLNLNDHDGDGVPDFRDIDTDNDGVLDFIEGWDDNADGIPDVTRYYTDLDRDGLDDAYDWIDGWGIPDLIDNETGSNSPLQDFDGDGWRDWRDTNDEDDPYMTHDEDINGNGDYSDDDLDLDGHPEYLDTEMDCELFIPEGFSPNDDGVHDFFQILCIYPRYPDAKMMIFNRNGQLLWEKEHYGNYDYWGWDDAWWWGTVDSRLVIGRSGGLPAGNYIYVLLLNDGSGEVKNGTVMLAY